MHSENWKPKDWDPQSTQCCFDTLYTPLSLTLSKTNLIMKQTGKMYLKDGKKHWVNALKIEHTKTGVQGNKVINRYWE